MTPSLNAARRSFPMHYDSRLIRLPTPCARSATSLRSSGGAEAIDTDRLIELIAACRKGLVEPPPHPRRQHGFLAVSVEAHVCDHPLGKVVEGGIAPRIRVGRDVIDREARPREMRQRFRGRFSHRGLVVEQLHDILMQPLRQRLGDVKAARWPQNTPRLGESALELPARHMMEREDKQNEIGRLIRLENGVGACFNKTEAAGAINCRLCPFDKRIVAGDVGAQRCQGAGHVPLAAANINDPQPLDLADRRQQRVEMRFCTEIADEGFGSFSFWPAHLPQGSPGLKGNSLPGGTPSSLIANSMAIDM